MTCFDFVVEAVADHPPQCRVTAPHCSLFDSGLKMACFVEQQAKDYCFIDQRHPTVSPLAGTCGGEEAGPARYNLANWAI